MIYEDQSLSLASPSLRKADVATHDQVAVIIPTLNEAHHIGPLLKQILDDLAGVADIFVTDGGSVDGTQEIVQTISLSERRVRLLNNPARLQAAGINSAVIQLPPEISMFVRIDAHALYPKGYVTQAITALDRTGADSVVVRLRTRGKDCFQRAVAAASNSVFGTGGAAHRVGGESRWIDHGHHAAFKRSSFEAIGGYDPSLQANEDAEFDVRLTGAGGRIWFESALEVDYFPRRTVGALAKQYYRYGKGRAQNFLKHRKRPHLRQLAPPAILAAVVVGFLLAPFQPLTLALPGGYFGLVVVASIFLTFRTKEICSLGGVVALPTMHLAWAVGFVLIFLRSALTGQGPASKGPGDLMSRSRKR